MSPLERQGSTQDGACTIIVRPGESIQAAIDRAPKGAVICLPGGEWQENIVIDKDLTLRGQGPGWCVLGATELEEIAVRIVSPWKIRVAIENVKIVRGKACIHADGRAEVNIEDCTLINSTYGIRLSGFAKAVVRGCTISQCLYGVSAGESSTVSIHHCVISNNRMEGISVWGAAAAEVSYNVIQKNGLGIESRSQGEVRGEENRMLENGLDLCGGLPGSLRIPLCPAIEEELIFPNDRYPTLQYALDAVRPGGRLILRHEPQDNELYETSVTIDKEITIEAEEGTMVTLKGSYKKPVLSLVRGANLTVRRIVVTGGVWGILLAADAQADIIDCRICECGDDLTIEHVIAGIELRDSSRANIIRCTISGNYGFGIYLNDKARATLENSTIADGALESFGVGVDGAAQLEIAKSTISNYDIGGILLEKTAKANVNACTVSGNGKFGIEIRDSAHVAITNCCIARNGRGVVIYNAGSAYIIDNRIVGNEEYGVQMLSGLISGKENHVPGPGGPDGNKQGAFSPQELSFLVTREGGTLDRRQLEQ